MEIFKTIEGFSKYQVSNYGRVKSFHKCSDGIIMKGGKDTMGYYLVILHNYGVKKTMRVHQLVAIAFLGNIPCGHKIVVDHIDEDKLNNNADNLQLITQRENTTRSIKRDLPTGVYKRNSGRYSSRIKVNGKIILLGTFDTIKEASDANQLKLFSLIIK